MDANEYQIIKLTCITEEIQSLSCVEMAQRQWTMGRLRLGIIALRADADKIRPINPVLYGLINNYK
jgi:hypothetical protein